VTAYKDLLERVIKRANGIEEEQTTLGDTEIMTDGGCDQDDTEFYVIDEDRSAVVGGPFQSKERASDEASEQGPSHIVATEGVLEMIELTSSTTIRWENDDVDVVTDGGIERQHIVIPEDGILTVAINGTEHEYDLEEGDDVVFEWQEGSR